jgi:lipopolysaccharide export LptBFGC system permease protein LptF
MNFLQLVVALWQSLNGKKFNTGAIVTLLAIVFQQVFSQFGVDKDQSVTMATYLVQAAGVIIMIVGYVHRLIKAKKP